ncbi:MAG: SET domain-containing protein-lysine N-methyltransferase [Chlamydiota bacterium]
MSLVEKNSSDAFTRSGVAIEYLDRSIGYGVFAKRNFPPYKALIHYTGILTLDQNIPDLNNSTFAFTEFSQYAIDGAYRGNWARFMNHADLGEKECNVIPWELYLPEGPRIVFTTGKRGVLKGEQLLYSYGDDYWEE